MGIKIELEENDLEALREFNGIKICKVINKCYVILYKGYNISLTESGLLYILLKNLDEKSFTENIHKMFNSAGANLK